MQSLPIPPFLFFNETKHNNQNGFQNMMYLLAIILPPVALLITGKVFQAIFNLVLIVISIVIFVGTLGFGSFLSFPLYIASIIHAVFVVHGARTDEKIEAAVRRAGND